MRTKMCRIIKSICFCLVAVLLINCLTDLLKPKWLENRWQSAKTNKSFYELDKNSLDVVFFGTSVAAASFNPHQLFEEYGISSYNLGVMSQPMVGTYFWMKEALKTQDIKVAVVEVRQVGRVTDKSEEKGRKSYDYMEWGKPKLQYAVEYKNSNKKLEGTEDEVDIWEYLFPLSLYHGRWSELTYEDFDFVLGNNDSYTRGFAALTDVFKYRSNFDQEKYEKGKYDGFEPDTDETDNDKYNDTNRAYVKRIAQLAKDNNVQLLFVKSPDADWNVKQYNYMKGLADENDVPYLDMNIKSIRQKIDFNYPFDAADTIHMNLNGSRKVTNYIGKYLHDHYDLTNHNEGDDEVKAIYEAEKANYNYAINNVKLNMETNVDNYLEMINSDDYAIIIAGGANSEKLNYTDKQIGLLKQIGVENSFFAESEYGANVISIHDQKLNIDKQGAQDKAHTVVTKKNGTLSDGTSFDITAQNKSCSVKIGGRNCANINEPYVNIVVYDKNLKEIADTVYLYSEDSAIKIGREG